MNGEIMREKLGQNLMRAAVKNSVEGVIRSLDAGADVNLRLENGNTALACAIRGGCLNVIPVLLQRGADPEIEYNRASFSRNALEFAMTYPSLKQTVPLLLEGGANYFRENYIEYAKKHLKHDEDIKAFQDSIKKKLQDDGVSIEDYQDPIFREAKMLDFDKKKKAQHSPRLFKSRSQSLLGKISICGLNSKNGFF